MPRPEKLMLVCVNERPPGRKESCGSDHGAEELGKAVRRCLKMRGLNKQFRATTSKCLGVCDGGPHAVVMPDNVWYAGFNEEDLEEIVESHLVGGVPVARLIAPEQPAPCKKDYEKEKHDG